MLIPVTVSHRGVIIIGAESITYHNGTMNQAIALSNLQESSVVSFARVDGNAESIFTCCFIIKKNFVLR